jgi:hypothetical protein
VRIGKSTLTDSLVAAAGIIAMENVRTPSIYLTHEFNKHTLCIYCSGYPFGLQFSDFVQGLLLLMAL